MNRYDKLASGMAEQLFDEGLDLDRFLPALLRAVKERAESIERESCDYEPEHLNWAEEQISESKLYLESLGEAQSDLAVAIRQSLPSDNEIIVSRMRSAKAHLTNLKRRMEVRA